LRGINSFAKKRAAGSHNNENLHEQEGGGNRGNLLEKVAVKSELKKRGGKRGKFVEKIKGSQSSFLH